MKKDNHVYQFLNSENQPLYIGKSTDLKSRISKHFDLSTPGHGLINIQKLLEVNQILYTTCNSHEHMNALESVLISKLDPKLNAQRKIEVNPFLSEIDIEWKEFEFDYFRFRKRMNAFIEQNLKSVPDEKTTYAFDLQQDSNALFKKLIYHKIVHENDMGYNLTALFKEGINILKDKYPQVDSETPLNRRYYRGGKQKSKGIVNRTSVVTTIRNKNWIDNYILYKMSEDVYFSKTDFINELVEAVRQKYLKEIDKLDKASI